MRLDGKVAIITGGSRGQGEAHARLFVAEGAKVLIGDVLDEPGEKLAASLNQSGLADAAIYRHLDVSSEADWAAAVQAAYAILIRLYPAQLDMLDQERSASLTGISRDWDAERSHDRLWS